MIDSAAGSSTCPSTIRLQHQVVLITGGAGGIGRSCADTFAAAGAEVVVADLRAAEGPDASAPEVIRCDVTREADVVGLFAQTLTRYGRIDALVNCAGVLEPVARTVDQELSAWERVIDVNLKAAFLVCREAGRAMLQRGSGAIVNIGSVAGLVGIPASTAYGPSKAALAHLTRNLACEWARRGIRVNCIAPGYVDTGMARGLFGTDEALQGMALKRVPMARLGEPTEIASVALFLCSPLASFVTGTVIPVDGGWSAFGGPSR
jgi:NAD(P)-dependent dehydrogenase (short-subunit alcohol dehydrogenase family)